LFLLLPNVFGFIELPEHDLLAVLQIVTIQALQNAAGKAEELGVVFKPKFVLQFLKPTLLNVLINGFGMSLLLVSSWYPRRLFKGVLAMSYPGLCMRFYLAKSLTEFVYLRWKKRFTILHWVHVHKYS
jgi:hypothetical protein